MKSILESAIQYAEKGWPVLPIWGINENGNCACMTPCGTNAGKHPVAFLVPNGLLNATTNLEIIKKWFEEKTYFNVGIATGKNSFVAVDVDWIDKDPNKGLPRHDDFPETLTIKSGSGAKQLWYLPNEILRNKQKIRSSIDIRANGGYVVAPPSKHISGDFYEFTNEFPLTPFPIELINQFAEFKPIQNNDFLLGQPKNERHNALVRFTYLIAGYVKLGKISVQEGWEMCLARRQEDDNFEEKTVQEWKDAYKSALNKKEVWPTTNKETEESFNPISIQDFLMVNFPAIQWQTHRLIPKDQITVFSGPPSAHKTMSAMDIAISSASGGKAFGNFESIQCPVLIINDDGDSPRNFQKRLKLFKAKADLPIYLLLGSGFKIENGFVEKIMKIIDDYGIKFIILDSFRGILPEGKNENTSNEVREVINRLRPLNALGVTILLIHHDRKKATGFQGYTSTDPNDLGEMMSGSADIRGATDCHVAMASSKKDAETFIVFTQTKCREDVLLPAFKVLVKSGPDSIELIHTGAYDIAEDNIKRVKNAIIKILSNNAEKYMSCEELVKLKPAGFQERTIKEAKKELEVDSIISYKTGKELQRAGSPSKHYYYLVKEEDEIRPEKLNF